MLIAIATFALVMSVRADQTFYIGPNNGLWSSGNDWDTGIQPMAGDDAIVGQFIPGRTGNVNVRFDSNYNSGDLHSLTLDGTGTSGAVILNQTSSGSFMKVSNNGVENIGTTAYGSSYNQSAGTNSFDFLLAIGAALNGHGTYHLSGTGALTCDGFGCFEFVGRSDGSVGVFTRREARTAFSEVPFLALDIPRYRLATPEYL